MVRNLSLGLLLALVIGWLPTASAEEKPLTIAYSDWPGWVAWEVGIQKGWFKEAGVNVEFKWFEYVPSMDAFAQGKVDACCMTNGDALVTGSTGAPSVMILLNDYSNGNDMVVAKAGFKSMKDLKGKTIGVELGFVSHLLLLNAIKDAGMKETDFTLKNIPTDQTPQALQQGQVDAIVAWQPNSGQALKLSPGSTAIYSSANCPGVIYDALCVNPTSLATRKADWAKVAKVWYKIADYIADEANKEDVLKIMSARVGLTPEEYEPLLKGTFLLNKAGNKKHFVEGEDFTSLYHSTKVVDEFQVANEVYTKKMPIEKYLDPSLLDQ